MNFLNLKKHWLLIIFFIVESCFLSAQVPDIYFVYETHEDTSVIGTFNYETQDYQFLFTVTPAIKLVNFSQTFDPFRKIIYYINTGACRSNLDVYAVDIMNQTCSMIGEINNGPGIIDLQYDFFSNSLMIRDTDSITSYSVDDLELISSYKLPSSFTGFFASTPYVYNTVSRTHMFYALFDFRYSYYFVCANIDSNSCNTVQNTLVQWPVKLVTDISSNKFYGVSHYYEDTACVVSINPENGDFTKICSLPSDYSSSYSSHGNGVFDSQNNKYIVPYHVIIGTRRIAIVDINTGTTETIPLLVSWRFQFMDDELDPILKLKNDTLWASCSDTYTWYKDDNVISGVNTRSIAPDSTGIFKFSTLNHEGDIVFSNEIYIEFANAIPISKREKNKLLVYPNPATNYVTVKSLNPSNNIRQIHIIDLSGKKQLFELQNEQISVGGLTKGIYLLQIELFNGQKVIRKIIKK